MPDWDLIRMGFVESNKAANKRQSTRKLAWFPVPGVARGNIRDRSHTEVWAR
jgi:hypothetical protein